MTGIKGLETKFLEKLQTVGINLGDQHPGALVLRHERHQRADRPAAQHHNVFAFCDFTQAYGVASDRHRLDQRGEPEREVRGKTMQSVSGYRPVGLHRALRVDAHEFQVLANVAVTGAAGRTIVAGIERHHRHRIAHRKAFDARPQRRHRAGHLVSQDLRQVNAPVHLAMIDMQVRSADSAVTHLDLHFARSGINGRFGTGGHGCIAHVKCRFHRHHLA